MKINEILLEGVNDPHIFKAVFTLGGPGSGKTTIAKQLLGHSGLRPIDVDALYTMIMSKNPIAGKYEKELYWHAGSKMDKKLSILTQGRVGLIIDGTGRRIDRLKSTKAQLEALGYDTMALFVNVDLDTALERNETRPRKVDPELVKQMHAEVRNNLGEMQKLFGNRLLIVDNSEKPDLSYYQKEIDKFLEQPPKKPQAQAWIQSQRQPATQKPKA